MNGNLAQRVANPAQRVANPATVPDDNGGQMKSGWVKSVEWLSVLAGEAVGGRHHSQR